MNSTKLSSFWSLLVLVIGPCVLLGGCATGVSVFPLRSFSPQFETLILPVRLDDKDRNRTDPVESNSPLHIATGNILSHAFAGSDPAFIISVASIDTKWSIVDLGFTGEFSSRIAAVLTRNGAKVMLYGQGTHREHGFKSVDACAQLAFERATADLASQIRALAAQ